MALARFALVVAASRAALGDDSSSGCLLGVVQPEPPGGLEATGHVRTSQHYPNAFAERAHVRCARGRCSAHPVQLEPVLPAVAAAAWTSWTAFLTASPAQLPSEISLALRLTSRLVAPSGIWTALFV